MFTIDSLSCCSRLRRLATLGSPCFAQGPSTLLTSL